MESDWEWVDELLQKKQELKPELPEDIAFMLMKRYPILEELIERFELELEL